MLNLEPIKQRLIGLEYGDYSQYINGRAGVTQQTIIDDLSNLIKEVKRLRLENDGLRAEVAALRDKQDAYADQTTGCVKRPGEIGQ